MSNSLTITTLYSSVTITKKEVRLHEGIFSDTSHISDSNGRLAAIIFNIGNIWKTVPDS